MAGESADMAGRSFIIGLEWGTETETVIKIAAL
jgi:hypothetical protein